MYVYGPVSSRRFGRSLGVSLIPAKTCTYNCVYCQLGLTNPCQVERERFFPKDNILRQIEERLRQEAVDVVTFSGDGEPTLSRDIGWLITQIKDRYAAQVAILTNGSLLGLSEVRKELERADIVAPNLDAGTQTLFRRSNRPPH